MGCAYVTLLRLTNSRFCVLYVRMNHFEAHLMASSWEVDSKLRYSGWQLVEVLLWEKGKRVNVMLQILDGFSWVWVLMYQHSKKVGCAPSMGQMAQILPTGNDGILRTPTLSPTKCVCITSAFKLLKIMEITQFVTVLGYCSSEKHTSPCLVSHASLYHH